MSSPSAPPYADPMRSGRDPGQCDEAAIREHRRSGLIAGWALLLIAGLAGFGSLYAIDGAVTLDSAARTAEDVVASNTTFRLGVLTLYAVAALDIVAAWALFRYFAPLHDGIARLTAWFRIAYASVLLVAAAQLTGVPNLLTGDTISGAQAEALVLMKISAYYDIWMAGLFLFGAHLIGLGYLAFRSGYVPRVLGVLLTVAGLGYAFDTASSVLLRTPIVVSTFTFFGEFALAVWLVVRGGRRSNP